MYNFCTKWNDDQTACSSLNKYIRSSSCILEEEERAVLSRAPTAVLSVRARYIAFFAWCCVSRGHYRARTKFGLGRSQLALRVFGRSRYRVCVHVAKCGVVVLLCFVDSCRQLRERKGLPIRIKRVADASSAVTGDHTLEQLLRKPASRRNLSSSA